jgi:TP901 family phage tail tape measure protein
MIPSAIRAGRAFVELFADDSMLVRTLRRAEAKVIKFGTNISSIGRKLLTFGAVSSLPFGLSMKVFSDFDDQMRAVKAVTNATGNEFIALTEKAKLLGRTTSFTASQVASAMLELGRAGFAPQEIDAAIPSVLNLARATGTDLAMSAEICANTLRSFELPAEQMTRVCDVMVASANNSAQTLLDLGESMTYCAPIASEYGLSLEQTAKALGSLANYGIKGSQAGTTLRRILTNFADTKVQEKLKNFGITIVDNDTGKLREVSAILRDLGKATQQLPKDQKLGLFKKIFGLYAIAGGAKLTVAQFDKLIESVDNAAGAGDRAAREMDSGIGGSLRMFWSAVEGVAIAIGEALNPVLQKLTDYFTAATSGLAAYITQNKELIISIAKIIAVITGIGAAFLVTGLAIIGVGKAIGILAILFATVAQIALAGLTLISGAVAVLGLILGGTVTAFAAIAGGLGIVLSGIATTFAVALSSLAFIGSTVFGMIATIITALLSPIGLVVLAITAVGVAAILLSRSFSGIGNFISNIFNGIGSVLSGVVSLMSRMWNGLVGNFTTVFNTLGNIVTDFGNFFVTAFQSIGTAVDWLKNMFGTLCSFATETFGAITTALGRGDIEAVIQLIWASIKLIWIKGSTSLLSTWYWLTETLQTTWAICVFTIAELLTNAWFGVQEFWTDTVYTMSTLWLEFSSDIISAWKIAEQTIAQGISYIIAKMQGLDPNEMSNLINEDYNRQSQQRENEKRQKLTNIQQQRDTKIVTLESDRQGVLNNLYDDFDKNAINRKTDYNAKITAQETELQTAKNAYNDAINNARNPTKPDGTEEPQSLAERLNSKAEELIKGFKTNNGLGSKISVSGSFSAAAIQSMGVGSSIDRVAKATEKSEKHLEKLASKNEKTDKQPAKKNDEEDTNENEYLAFRELKQQTRYLRDISEHSFTPKFV